MNRFSEKHKFYFLMVMVCIAGLVGYLRFFRTADAAKHQSPSIEAQKRPPATPAAQHVSMQSKNRENRTQYAVRKPISRNIFEPAGPLPVIAAPTPTASTAMPAQMSLSGTVISGDHSLAIINNQFVRQGQKLGRYRITRITPDKVYLSAGEEQHCLSVINVSPALNQ